MASSALKKRFRRIIGLCSLFSLLAAGPLLAQENMLWAVEDGSGSRMFLYGSIHMATPDIYPLPPVVENAFDISSRLMVEADVTNPDIAATLMEVTMNGMYKAANEDLWQEIGPELSDGLKACAAKSTLPDELFARLKPWLAAVTLEAMRLKVLGFDENLGLDRHFLLKAKEKGMAVSEIESMSEQMEIFTTMTPSESRQLLRATVLECDSGAAEIRNLIDVWRNGDLSGFEKLYFQIYTEYPELAPLLDKVIFQRNDLMHGRLQPFLVPGQTTFAVIGAAHMVGSRGIPELFRAQGMKVTRY
ncbi:MAG: TraB/GumN family protein [Deltaproteobacteria bacterium]|jgi:uncharacterized protein YbaP (TraB family)|nr:TraB/GumN family protein [Deltaproteobacteria bacterium]